MLIRHGLFDMIAAANNLDIKPLLNLMSPNVASLMKGKNPDEIRNMGGHSRG